MTLDKLSLLAALAAAPTAVAVEGLGTVNLRQISVAESDTLRRLSKADTDANADPSAFGLRLVLASLVDDSGNPMLTEADLDALRQSAGAKVDKLVEAVLLINGFTKPAPGTAEAKNAAS